MERGGITALAPHRTDALDQRISIEGLVGDDRARSDTLDEAVGLRHVIDLPTGEHQVVELADPFHQRIDSVTTVRGGD